jgi:hypothetical protein
LHTTNFLSDLQFPHFINYNQCMDDHTPRRYLRDPLGRRLRGHRTSTGLKVREQKRDIALSVLFGGYRYLRSDMARRLLSKELRGANETRFKDRFTILFHETSTPYGQAYLDWPEQQDTYYNARYTSGIFEQGAGAAMCLAKHGITPEPRDFFKRSHEDGQFPHSLNVCDTIASIEAGFVDNPKFRLITWQEIFAKAPVPSRAFPVTVSYTFPGKRSPETHSFNLIPDNLFGIEYVRPDGSTEPMYFAHEAECKNRVCTTTFKSNSWMKKYLGYRYVLKHRLYEKRLGLPNLHILTTPPTWARVETMTEFIMQVTDGKGSTPFFFHPMPVISYKYPERKFPPVPYLFTDPLHRAGHPPIHLNQL